jgi:hypothetical protein
MNCEIALVLTFLRPKLLSWGSSFAVAQLSTPATGKKIISFSESPADRFLALPNYCAGDPLLNELAYLPYLRARSRRRSKCKQ